jgi:hypothetical protein
MSTRIVKPTQSQLAWLETIRQEHFVHWVRDGGLTHNQWREKGPYPEDWKDPKIKRIADKYTWTPIERLCYVDLESDWMGASSICRAATKKSLMAALSDKFILGNKETSEAFLKWVDQEKPKKERLLGFLKIFAWVHWKNSTPPQGSNGKTPAECRKKISLEDFDNPTNDIALLFTSETKRKKAKKAAGGYRPRNRLNTETTPKPENIQRGPNLICDLSSETDEEPSETDEEQELEPEPEQQVEPETDVQSHRIQSNDTDTSAFTDISPAINQVIEEIGILKGKIAKSEQEKCREKMRADEAEKRAQEAEKRAQEAEAMLAKIRNMLQ